MKQFTIYESNVSSTGIVTYAIELDHPGLKKHRVIEDRDPDLLARRAQTQLDQWAEQWAKKQARQEAAEARAAAKRQKEQAQQEAQRQTEAAQERLTEIDSTLHHTLTHDDTVEWDSLKDSSTFPEVKPRANLPPKPKLHSQPAEPYARAVKYKPTFSFFDNFSSRRKDARRQEAKERYDADQREWQKECERVTTANEKLKRKYETALARAKSDHQSALDEWRDARDDFLAKQRAQNRAVEEHRTQWQSGDTNAVEAYCDIVLSASSYDECCPQEFELEYNRENRMLVVDYQLPAPDALPTLSEVKYIISRQEFTEKNLPVGRQRQMYDSLLYQITLRTLHELFEADSIGALDAVVFNGVVTSIDKGTGQKATACVLSIQASRQEFEAIDLQHVEPKTCFRRLKGVGSTKLHSITPVAPLQTLSRDDSRFVADQGVIDVLKEGDNLAAMDWEEFEHLIREVFGKEFSGDGGEVKVTRASRDGGVDAVAFDPDPIRGGKIVIQAKRYTNTVGVAAVRDLYGTVMNEGAMKGILVTTSSYGPDAYSFASDKPITLLDGGHLLHILERHGHKARINLAEAKELMS